MAHAPALPLAGTPCRKTAWRTGGILSDIFIGYRRDDGGHARALYEKLLDWYDAGRVFLDHENLPPGAKFRAELDQAVKNCRLAGTLRAQGDLPAARALQERALEIRRRVLGDEHPDTSISAFNLFATLLQCEGGGEQAMDVLQSRLAWLLGRNPASLGAKQA